ncbi:hypothetical protein Pla163_37830 [Planctomycetes bacterium Pla163]|uniref:Uncharacterized protein n=2 Tax=Rohdeia mirabilis TaxID=2528008 RepID=A0A518D578_9BACT|nr:hypothetical protein Pla163_37830 [Planctomycetes bacterium Pla163]
MAWTATALLGLLSVTFIVGNPLCGLRAMRAGRGYSFVPLVGGLAGAAAILICPCSISEWWVLAPLMLDYSIPCLLALPVIMMTRRGST